MEGFCVGDTVQVMTRDELEDRLDADKSIDGLLWVPSIMDCVLGEEVHISKLHMNSDVYSERKFDDGYYEFSVSELPTTYHLNPAMLHTGPPEVLNIDEIDWSSVAFG